MEAKSNIDVLVNDWVVNNTGSVIFSEANDQSLPLMSNAQADTAGGSAILIGNKSGIALKEAVELKALYNKKELDKLAKSLVSSPANFVTTVMGISQQRTQWDPLAQDQTKSAEQFHNYIKQIVAFPLMVITKTDTTHVHYQSENYDSLIDNISDLYTGISDSDKNSIRKGVVNLAKSCMQRVGETSSTVLFTQSTITADDVVKVYFYSSAIKMVRSHESGKSAPSDSFKSDVSVSKVEISFNRAALTFSIARKICEVLYKGVDDWLAENTTPADKTHQNYCFH